MKNIYKLQYIYFLALPLAVHTKCCEAGRTVQDSITRWELDCIIVLYAQHAARSEGSLMMLQLEIYAQFLFQVMIVPMASHLKRRRYKCLSGIMVITKET